MDGKLSQWAYLSSVDTCYQRYKEKYAKKHSEDGSLINVDHFDYFAFHSPYNKLVQKGFARLLFIDSLTASEENEEFKSVGIYKDMPMNETYESKEVESAFKAISNSRFV